MPDRACLDRRRPTPSPPARVVCVLGMHRSGTSVVASLVEALGVHFGDQGDLLAALPENPRGYWEHRAINAINAALLARLGGAWDAPPLLPDGWARAPELADLRAEARAIVAALERRGRWGWKDPRTCLTLPFWQAILPAEDAAAFILCVRHPLDVAASLHVRDGLPMPEGVHLWLSHTAAALHHTAGCRRLVVQYEELLADPRFVADALAAHLGTPALGDERLAALVAPGLRHHRTTAADGPQHPLVPQPIHALYQSLRAVPATAGGEALDAATILARQALDEAAGSATPCGTAPRLPVALVAPLAATVAQRLRRAASDYLSRRPSLGGAYRRLRRSARRALGYSR